MIMVNIISIIIIIITSTIISIIISIIIRGCKSAGRPLEMIMVIIFSTIR